MIRVTDYIANYLSSLGIKDVFLVTGGGMMFLSDGIAKHKDLSAICTHHEQSAAMAAVSYSKYNQNFGVAYVTTGCGGTNALTGLLGAYQDNIPCLFISGQSKRKETVRNSGLPLRQFGVQEADIISIVENLTKYAVMINDSEKIAYYLEKAVYIAKSGRPGPVWLDIPLDVQSALVDENNLERFNKLELEEDYKFEVLDDEIKNFKLLIKNAKRPIIVAGQGIRLSGAISGFKELIEKYKIPFVTSRLGIDVLPSQHELYTGRIGNKGDRAGNFAVQNADFVLVLGSRLSVSSTGHEYHNFAREAKIIVCDIDPFEHKKNTVKIDLMINSDLKQFINLLNEDVLPLTSNERWIEKCKEWKIKWPVFIPEFLKENNKINLYHFVDSLSKKMKNDAVVLSDAGSAFYVVSQGIQLNNERQRYITSGGQAEMGYTLPAAIGVCIAKGRKEVIGITGDGSFQMNIQELQTIVYYKLPVKIFVWNNDGYLSIRASQRKFFEERYIGTDETSGVSFPDLKKISKAYGIKYFNAAKPKSLNRVLEKVLAYDGPVICEVMCIRDQEIIPSVASYKKDDGTMVSKPLEDMYPFLDRDEFKREMIVKPLDE